ASQTLVRKSRRDSLRKSAELEVERVRVQYDARKAEVERDARTAWIDAAAAENQITATREILRVLQSVTDASRIQYEAGAVPQTDLIRATLEQRNVDHQILVLRRQRNAAVARLLPLLQLPQGTPVPGFSLPQAMERPHGDGIDATLPDSTAALAELQSEVARAEEDLNLAKLATKPDINLEATYGVRPRDVDMFAVVARIELPVRRSTLIAPRIREAILRRDAGLQQIEAMRLQLRQDLGTALVLRNEAIEQINFHLDHFVPIAKLGFESALVSYQNGKTSLDSVLGTLRTYISLNVDYYDYLRQQMAAEADIDAIRHGARSGGASAMTAAPATSMPAASASGTRMK
ncbi:MAG: TolC family protein, partial [Thermoanaerobaculia bacterium]